MTLEKILVVAETRGGVIRDATLELLGVARGLANESGAVVVLAVIGARAAELAGDVARGGADEIVVVPTPLERFDSVVHQRALDVLIEEENPTLILAAHSVDSMSFAPALAASRGMGFASDVVAVSLAGELTAERGAYGDKLVATLRFPGHEAVLLMIRVGAAVPPDGAPPAEIRNHASVDADPAIMQAEIRPAATGDVDITSADFLLAIGRGVDQEEEVGRFEELAKQLGATLAVSRPLVDAGWSDAARQVGQSGRVVKPRVYLAIGISGAIQHLAGIREAGTVIAVNNDPEAPIFGVADYGAVVDLFDLADELERAAG